jgi:Pectinacetylesterase
MQAWTVWTTLALGLWACSSDAGSGMSAAGGGGQGGAGLGVTAGTSSTAGTMAGAAGQATEQLDASTEATADAGTVRGPFAPMGLDYDVPEGAPIDAPAGGWTYVAFPEAKCANGTSTGIALQPSASPEGLLIFMQGGGACWDATTCLELDASVHLKDTVGESIVLAEAGQVPLFNREQVLNPFRNYHYVYIPYCTGDLHSGSRAETYQGMSGPVTIHHHGGLNVDAYLSRLVPTFADEERVVISGISAGGYGATLNWWRYQAAFDEARVDVFNDAGLMLDASDDRYTKMVSAWGMMLPPGCDACDDKMSAWLPFYAGPLGAPRRYALAGFTGDAVIGQYFGLDANMIEAGLLAQRAATGPNQKTLLLPGTKHSVLGEGLLDMASDGASLLPWLAAFESDSTSWDHAGP